MRGAVKPDASKRNSDHEYIADLINRTSMTSRELGDALDVPSRDIRHFRGGTRECPYLVQFALECLAREN